MSGDLALRLREVAHKADAQAHNRAILAVIGKRMSVEEKRTVLSWVRSTAVAAAVLRELADAYPPEAETNATPAEALELYSLAEVVERGAM